MITAVLGGFGVGKTHWIKEQIQQKNEDIFYFSPQTQTFPVDGAFLQSFYPDLSIVGVKSASELMDLGNSYAVFLEIPEYLDLDNINPLISALECHCVAIVGKEENQGKWSDFADEIIINQNVKYGYSLDVLPDLQIHRASLMGEVLDYASLETFWQELTLGAYGEILRGKGIFNILDGQCVYGEYLKDSFKYDFQPLDLPLSLEGRPTYFSGLEVVGNNLDKQGIADTLGDFCLADEAVSFYQQQVKQVLENK